MSVFGRRRWLAIVLALIVVALAVGLLGLSREGAHNDLAPGLSVTEVRIDNANAYLVHDPSDSAQALLIDSGAPGGGAQLAQRIREAGVLPQDIKVVILTHGHYDHAGGARYLQETYGVPVIMGAGDAEALATGREQAVCPTSRLAEQIPGEAGDAKAWALTPDQVVMDRLSLSDIPGIGFDGELRVTGGHTPGSLVAVIGNSVFVGDLVRGSLWGSGPEVHFFMCDLDGNARDLDRLLDTLPDRVTRVFPGHMGAFDRDALRRHVDDRLTAISNGGR